MGTITLTERVTIFAEGVRSKLPITWGTQAAPITGEASRRDAMFPNIYNEPIKVLAVDGALWHVNSDGSGNPSRFSMLIQLKPSRGFAWMNSARPLYMFSDIYEYARLEFSYLPAGGLILQPQEGFLIELYHGSASTATFVASLEAYMPRDPAKLDWHDQRTLWSPILQMGAVIDFEAGTVAYLPFNDPGAVIQDSFSNETDRPILVRALSLRHKPVTPAATRKGYAMTIKIRKKNHRVHNIAAREILGGVSNYASPGIGMIREVEQRLFTFKRPYVMEPNETLQVTYGMCSDEPGASGYETIPDDGL